MSMSRKTKIIVWSIAAAIVAIGIAIIVRLLVFAPHHIALPTPTTSIVCDYRTGNCTEGWDIKGWTESDACSRNLDWEVPYDGPLDFPQNVDGKSVCQYSNILNIMGNPVILSVEKEGTFACPSVTLSCPCDPSVSLLCN